MQKPPTHCRMPPVPVVIDGVSLIIQNTGVERRFPGGIVAYERACPNATYCSDGEICRVAFTVEAEGRSFAGGLTRHGFVNPWSAERSDVAVAALHVNLLFPCDWLEIDVATMSPLNEDSVLRIECLAER